MISAIVPISQQLAAFTFLSIMLMSNPNNRDNGYYTAVVFSDPDKSYTDRIIQIINSDSNIPTKVCTFKDGALLESARQYEGPSDLNVFVVPRASELIQFRQIQRSIFYSDLRLLLIMSSDATDEELLDSIRQHLSGFKSLLIFRPNSDLCLYRATKYESIACYQLDLTKPAAVLEVINSIANWRKMDWPYWSPIMFVHYYPPFNMVAPNYNTEGKYIATELIGPDPMMAYDIAKRLNVTDRVVTDLDTVSIGYDSYFGEHTKEGAFGDYVYRTKYYGRVVLNRPPLDYNYT